MCKKEGKSCDKSIIAYFLVQCEIYFACKPEYKDILINNPYITKVLDYLPIMDNQIIMEGTAQWKGLFDISIMATVLTQRIINYLNNGETRIMFDLRED